MSEGKAEIVCPGAVWIYPDAVVGECSLLEKDMKDGGV